MSPIHSRPPPRQPSMTVSRNRCPVSSQSSTPARRSPEDHAGTDTRRHRHRHRHRTNDNDHPTTTPDNGREARTITRTRPPAAAAAGMGVGVSDGPGMGGGGLDAGDALTWCSVIMVIIGVTRDNAGSNGNRGSAGATAAGIYILAFIPVCGFVWGAAGVCGVVWFWWVAVATSQGGEMWVTRGLSPRFLDCCSRGEPVRLCGTDKPWLPFRSVTLLPLVGA